MISVEGKKRTCGSHFLDSGAFSLYQQNDASFFQSKAFWKYVDRYAKFLKKYQDGIDYYASVDVLYQPQLTWDVLKYMESEHGLNPVPVIHLNTDLKWLRKHVGAGYKFIAFGGLAFRKNDANKWLDHAFDYICPSPTRLPIIRVHGFAVTAYPSLIKYPWWSVDSVSWAKAAGFGSIYVPHKRYGKFTFETPPYNIATSTKSASAKVRGQNLSTLTTMEQKIVHEWLEKIDVPLGRVDKKGKSVEYGVISEYHARAVANLRFFEALRKCLPKWPWPFLGKRHGFGDE